jgi:hypothetical protein
MRHSPRGLDVKRENMKREKYGEPPDISMKIVDF